MKLTDEQIELHAKHAAEGARLQATQQNERVDMLERQRAERVAAGMEAPSGQQQQPAPANDAHQAAATAEHHGRNRHHKRKADDER